MALTKKAPWKAWAGIGASGLICIVLVGITIGDMGTLEELESEWERKKPQVEKGRKIAEIDQSLIKTSTVSDEDPMVRLPRNREELTFSALLREAVHFSGVTAKVTSLEDQLWPNRIHPTRLKKLPLNREDFFQLPSKEEGEDGGWQAQKEADIKVNAKIHPYLVEFESGFDAAVEFCKLVEGFPRYAQIVSVEVESIPDSGSSKFKVIVESYSWGGSQ